MCIWHLEGVCLNWGLIALVKAMTTNNLGRKGFMLPHPSLSLCNVRAETEAGHWRSELKQQRPFEECVACSPCSLNLFPHTTKDCPSRDSTVHSGLGPPTSITNQENVLKICYRSSEGISVLSVLLLDNSSLCQSDKRPPRIEGKTQFPP